MGGKFQPAAGRGYGVLIKNRWNPRGGPLEIVDFFE